MPKFNKAVRGDRPGPAPVPEESRETAGGEGGCDEKVSGSGITESAKLLSVIERFTRGRSRICLSVDGDSVRSSTGQIYIGMVVDIALDVAARRFRVIMVPELPPGSGEPDTVKVVELSLQGDVLNSAYIDTHSMAADRAFPNANAEEAQEELACIHESFQTMLDRHARVIEAPDWLLPFKGVGL